MKNTLLIFLFILPLLTFAQNEKTLQAVRTTEKIKIDGQLNESVWQKAPAATDFVQFEPNNGAKPGQHTVVKVLYDQTGIYIGAYCYDTSPDSIRLDLTQRDEDAPTADAFGIIIDPFNQGLYGYMFIVTAAGVQSDGKITPRGDDRSLDAVWMSETRKTNDGWVAEIKIPYSALRFSTAEKQTWKINFFRYIARYQELDSWNFIDKSKPGFVSQSGLLTGLEDIKPPLRLAFMPYFSAYANNNAGQWSYFTRGGMDLKYGINESFTLDMMLIPDFGQVESDDQVLNLSPFETYYVEKRQFFTEGSELFSKGKIFYSRRIGAEPIDYYAPYEQLQANEVVTSNPSQTQIINATKITGRTQKGLGLGLLNAITLPAYATITDTVTGEQRQVMTQDYTNYNVLVLDQSLNGDSYVSFINTNMWVAGGRRLANTSAADYQIRLFDRKYTVSGVAAVSQRYGSDLDQPQTGFANTFNFEKSSGKFRYGIENVLRDKQYDINDMGYLRQNNIFETNLWTGYNQFTPQWIFINWYVRGTYGLHLVYDNLALHEEFLHFSMGGTFKNLWSLRMFSFHQLKDELDWYEPRVEGRYFRDPAVTFVSAILSTNPSKTLSFNINLRTFFTPDPNKHGYGFSTGSNLRVSSKFNMSYNLDYHNEYRYGYVYNTDTDIYFGYRHQKTITNTVSLRYIFTNKQGIRMRLRHYWSLADYSDQFYVLNEDGTLSPSDFFMNADINFNAFTIDMAYTWNFAPGSEIVLMWKNQIYTYDSQLEYDFFNNLGNTLSAPQMNSLSFKILYYLDWLYLKKKSPAVASQIKQFTHKFKLLG